MKSIWLNALAWVLAVSAALSMAFAFPSESSVMGRLPSLTARAGGAQPVSLPAQLPAQRTLAVLTFKKEQRPDAEEWIRGMELRDSARIDWIRMPVLEDPGDSQKRAVAEDKLMKNYAGTADGAKLMPVFTDRDAFVRQAALGSHDQVHILVLSREGDILARAEGKYDADKARALRETLLSQDF